MGDFIVLSFLLQGAVQIAREMVPRLDGKIVLAVAAALGIAAAFAFPEAQVATELTGLTISPILNNVVSGLGMALGAKVIRDMIKAVATSINKPGVVEEPEP